MIDTIVLRIHNLEKYEQTVVALFADKKEAVTKIFTNYKKGEGYDSLGLIQMVYHNSGARLPLAHRSSSFIASSHYSLSYLVSFEKDFLEFNFSIPKFKYGTNVFQFIDYYDQSPEILFKRLKQFIGEFITCSFFINKIESQDIEINRIDFCYNQFFPSAKDKENYLAVQVRKYGKKMIVRGKEGVYVVKDRYSFKIYDKGAEFRKNDFKELMSMSGVRNKKSANVKGYDLQRLAEISDCVLRYEITYRNSFFNYAFKCMYYDRGKSSVYNNIYRILYKKYRIDGKVGDIFAKKSGNIKRKQFYVSSRYDDWRRYKDLCENDKGGWIYQFRNDHSVTFDFHLFSYLYRYFWSYVKKYQVVTSVSPFEFEKRLGQINEDIDVKNAVRSVKLKKRDMSRLLHYAILSKDHSLGELLDKKLISRATYYRLLTDFKRVGLSEFNPDVVTVKPTLDYQDYKRYFGALHH